MTLQQVILTLCLARFYCVACSLCVGALQYLMKEHDKAMLTYKQGLEHNPDNQELKEGVDNCIRALSR